MQHTYLPLKQFLAFDLIDNRVLNPDSHRYAVASRMITAIAVSQSFKNITIAEYQYSSKVSLSNCISVA